MKRDNAMSKEGRKYDILYTIVREYIKTAEPVGSRTIEKKGGLGISSATIRNEMSDLEDLGFLIQPHASAGRIPSEKAYRMYVDQFIDSFSEQNGLALKIREQYSHYFAELNEAVRKAAEILTKITSYTALVSMPEISSLGVREVRFVLIEGDRILFIIITNESTVKNAEMRLSFSPTAKQLEKAANFLNYYIKGSTDPITMANFGARIGELKSAEQKIIAETVPAINTILNADIKTRVYADGLTEILNYPEFQDVSKAKLFIEAMHQQELLACLLASAMESESGTPVDIKIGKEVEIDGLTECSVLTATYKLNGKPLGTIGLIGPTRMDYSKCTIAIKTMSTELSRHINISMGGRIEDG
ncbi:MAG: heat-inducible transcriptional repressor HrcA [Eubacteriaceae bacterium]|jgi:heat-inducible transcriptional repressor|nr:heat-inducible transcriptional repressor HrcA [Eubacteriaceae bacterium]